MPKCLSSTSNALDCASIIPLGLYSQPPHAVGTLTLGPQEATFCPTAANSFTTASKSSICTPIISTDCLKLRWQYPILLYFLATSATFVSFSGVILPPGTFNRTVKRTFCVCFMKPPDFNSLRSILCVAVFSAIQTPNLVKPEPKNVTILLYIYFYLINSQKILQGKRSL